MARTARMVLVVLLATACMIMTAPLSAGQTAPAPAANCQSELVELFPCLDFLTNSSVPTAAPACCSALTNVSTSSPFCLCQLISPTFSNQSAQLGINDTRALLLPGICSLNIGPANCAAILGPSASPAPALVPVSAPAPIGMVPTPAFSPLSSLAPVEAPIAGAPDLTPESSASPGPSADCNSEVSKLAGCLTFLTGSAASPSSSCCTNLGTVVSEAPQCLCTLASNGALSQVNVTLVNELPGKCKVSASLSECASVGSPISIGSGAPEGSPSYGAKSATASTAYMVIALSVVAVAHALLQ